jgi:hypothetical protein
MQKAHTLRIIVPFAAFSLQLASMSEDIAKKMRGSVSSTGAVVDVQNSCWNSCAQVFWQAMFTDNAEVYDNTTGKQIFSIDHVNVSSGCGMGSSGGEYLVLPDGNRIMLSVWNA